MKLTKTEFEAELKSALELTGDQRKNRIASLKAATVVEVDEKGVETPVKMEIVETAETKAAEDAAKAKTVDAEAVQRLVQKSVEDALAKSRAEAAAKRPATDTGAAAGNKSCIPATVRKSIPKYFGAKTLDGRDGSERAYRFGMWAAACMGNEKAKAFCQEQGIILKLHSENVNTTGGFLVPEEFSTDIIDLKEQFGVFRQYASIEPMSTDVKNIPRRTGGLTAYPVAEGAAGTESTMGWDQVKLIAKDWMVLTRMTGQVNEDSMINFGDRLAYEISYAFAYSEDKAGFVGDGTSTYSGITGVTKALINFWGTSATTAGIYKSTATAWSSVTLADFNNVVGLLPQFADTPNAAWYCTKAFYGQVMQRLLDAAGANTAVVLRDESGGRTRIFLDYPVRICQAMPNSYAALGVPCVFGDLSLAATFGDRKQDTIDFSTQATLNGQSLWERNEIGVRGIERFDIVVHDVGQTITGPNAGTNAGPVVGLMTT